MMDDGNDGKRFSDLNYKEERSAAMLRGRLTKKVTYKSKMAAGDTVVNINRKNYFPLYSFLST